MDSADELLRDSVIAEFYANKTILITGGTGYLGKLLIEKFLRSCPNLKEILVLIRPKKNKCVEERITILRSNDIFKSVREINPNLPLKIHSVAGDITQDYLGLNSEDLERVTNSVNIFFHLGAATVLDAKLKFLVVHNITGVNNAINVANKIKNLNAFINVSTILSVYNDGQIEEKIYPTNFSAKSLMDLANGFDDNILNKITSDLKKEFANNYAYTKAVADNLIQERCQHLPVGVYRPPAVSPLHREPIPGWMDCISISNGVCLGIMNGMVRIFNSTSNTPCFIVPGEYATNCLIAIGWDVAHKPHGITVYNYISNYKPTMQMLVEKFTHPKYPLENTFRYPSIWIIPIHSEKLHNVLLYIFHTLPARVREKIFTTIGLKYRLSSTMDSINKLLRNVAVLHRRKMVFQIKNTENLLNCLSAKDKQIFNFDLNTIDWNDYFDVFAYGLKTITQKEDMANINKAKMKRYLMMILHYSWIIILAISGSVFYKYINEL